MPKVSLDTFIAGAKSGAHLVSFWTDTVPALAALPDQAERIFDLKQRRLDKPLILMGATLDDFWPYLSGTVAERAIWRRVADRYWPGPLTLVLPANDHLPLAMNPAQTGSVGVRIPNHPIALHILAQTGPLATTSANRSGSPALLTMAEINAQFPSVLTLSETALANLPSIEAPNLIKERHDELAVPASGVPSTIAQWTGKDWRILRQGTVQLET
ncbi:MAG: L-threonylcarbamoyladenylate synthase [Leptolyngbyaceae cyanobacterium MO_188.B28]|nr:L-threonylcarbamoyladenylate synthase [Leptolyngbyaceae cyanobacterium MO_188.B28]